MEIEASTVPATSPLYRDTLNRVFRASTLQLQYTQDEFGGLQLGNAYALRDDGWFEPKTNIFRRQEVRKDKPLSQGRLHTEFEEKKNEEEEETTLVTNFRAHVRHSVGSGSVSLYEAASKMLSNSSGGIYYEAWHLDGLADLDENNLELEPKQTKRLTNIAETNKNNPSIMAKEFIETFGDWTLVEISLGCLVTGRFISSTSTGRWETTSRQQFAVAIKAFSASGKASYERYEQALRSGTNSNVQITWDAIGNNMRLKRFIHSPDDEKTLVEKVVRNIGIFSSTDVVSAGLILHAIEAGGFSYEAAPYRIRLRRTYELLPSEAKWKPLVEALRAAADIPPSGSVPPRTQIYLRAYQDAVRRAGVHHHDQWGPNALVSDGNRPSEVEYKFFAPVGASYTLQIAYAMVEPRPISVRVNGQMVASQACARITGGPWFGNHFWEDVPLDTGIDAIKLQEGENSIILSRDGHFPHLHGLRLLRLD